MYLIVADGDAMVLAMIFIPMASMDIQCFAVYLIDTFFSL
jgi:hypothetical protein